MPHQFCEVSGKHWKKSLEPFAEPKMDQLWRNALCRSLQVNLDKFSYDEVTGLPLDAIKEKLMFMRKLRVYHVGPASFLDMSGLNAIGRRWVHEQG